MFTRTVFPAYRLIRPNSRSIFTRNIPNPSLLPTTTISTRFRAMSGHGGESTLRPEPDKVLQDIADYIHNYKIDSPLAFETARLCLIDTIGCGLEGLRFPECTKLLGPVVEGTIVPNGMQTLGLIIYSSFTLLYRNQGSRDQLSAWSHTRSVQHWDYHSLAWFQWLFLGCRMYNSPFYQQYPHHWPNVNAGGHPSDNLGAILAVADHLARQGQLLTVHDILEGMIKAHEIQGSLALLNSYNRVGLDHVVLVKVASTAVVSKMLGLNRDQTIDAVSQAWVDGQSLRRSFSNIFLFFYFLI